MIAPMPQTVVGAIIVDSLTSPTRVLAARRTRPSELSGLWEFPGGKVESDEPAETALRRELREELALEVHLGGEVCDDGGPWPISDRYELRLFLATILHGDALPGTDHDELRWLEASELESVPWLPSDRRAIGLVRQLLTA